MVYIRYGKSHAKVNLQLQTMMESSTKSSPNSLDMGIPQVYEKAVLLASEKEICSFEWCAYGQYGDNIPKLVSNYRLDGK